MQVGFVFLANPHSASRATAIALLQIEGSVEVAPHHADLSIILNQYPDASACATVFQIVRHPLDWLVSLFLCNGGQRSKFVEWLRRRPKRPIYNRFRGQTNCFGKYESLSNDLARLTGQEIKLERVRDHKTPGKVKDYMAYWCDQMDIDWALKHFANDFETYSYDTNIKARLHRGFADYR